jgi:hypothetical protein
MGRLANARRFVSKYSGVIMALGWIAIAVQAAINHIPTWTFIGLFLALLIIVVSIWEKRSTEQDDVEEPDSDEEEV